MNIQFENLVENFFGEAAERLGDGYLAVLDKCGIPKGTKSFSRLPATQLNKLCNELFVTFDSIAAGNIDFSALESHMSGGSRLPTKYVMDVPYSSRFTSIYMLNYLRSVMGDEPVRYLCQHFQLKGDQFSDLAEKNNLLLPHDICSYVHEYFGEDVVRSMGESSFDLFKKTAAARELTNLNSVHGFFEKFIFDIMPVHVERNFSWTIDKTGPGFIQISGQPHGDVSAALNFHHQGIESLEILRQGFIQALPRLIGLQNVEVTRVRSISSGDPFDTYLIHYGQTVH